MTASPVAPTSSFVPRSDLDLPLYGAPMPQALNRFFEKYSTFRGRASLSEFWWAMLMVNVVLILGWVFIGVLLYVADSVDTSAVGPVSMIVFMLIQLFLIVPTLAIQVRRLHNAGLSGWLILLNLVWVLGGIALLVLYCLPSSPSNQYGPGPETLGHARRGGPAQPAAVPSPDAP